MLRCLALCAAVLLLAAPAALADVRNDIITECEAGELRGSYSPGELRDARNNLPSDIRQYTDCEEILNRALTGIGGGGGSGGDNEGGPGGGAGGGTDGGGGGGGPLVTPTDPEEQRALEDAAADPPGPLTLGDGTVRPGAAGLSADALRHSLPTPLLAVLIALGLAAVAALVAPLRRLAARRPTRTPSAM